MCSFHLLTFLHIPDGTFALTVSWWDPDETERVQLCSHMNAHFMKALRPQSQYLLAFRPVAVAAGVASSWLPAEPFGSWESFLSGTAGVLRLEPRQLHQKTHVGVWAFSLARIRFQGICFSDVVPGREADRGRRMGVPLPRLLGQSCQGASGLHFYLLARRTETLTFMQPNHFITQICESWKQRSHER